MIILISCGHKTNPKAQTNLSFPSLTEEYLKNKKVKKLEKKYKKNESDHSLGQ